MSDEPKFSFFRLSIKPISSRNRNGRKTNLISPADTAPREERRTNLKRAIFFLAVAILLIVARQLAKNAPATSGQPSSMLNVGFDLSIQEPSGRVAGEDYHSESSGYLVRFRLTNRGARPVACPVHPGTNVLVGRAVYRTTKESDWMAFPWPSKSAVSAAQERIDQSIAWIEIPPGGWIDGQFHDPGWPGGDHAYAVDLKPEPNASIVSFVSPPYHLPIN